MADDDDCREAVTDLALGIRVTEDDLMDATTALVNEPFSTDRLAEAIGSIQALKHRLRATLRALQMPGVLEE